MDPKRRRLLWWLVGGLGLFLIADGLWELATSAPVPQETVPGAD